MKQVDEYIHDLKSHSPVSLLPKEAIEHLLTGFSVKLQAGVALLYPLNYPAERSSVGRFDSYGGEDKAREFFHPICSEFRRNKECAETCRCFDERVALSYFDGTERGPKLYKCHLGLWDMTYPLVAGERVCGVLFAGQIITDDPQQLLEVETNLRDHKPPEHMVAVRDTLYGVIPRLTQAGMQDRYKEFCSFGEAMQAFVATSYDQVFESRFREFLIDLGVLLTTEHSSDESRWWSNVSNAVLTVKEFIPVSSLSFFSRKTDKYELKVTDQHLACDGSASLRTRLFAGLDHDKLMILPKECMQDCEKLLGESRGETYYVFKCDLPGERDLGVSTVIVLKGNIGRNELARVEEFCRLVALRADVTKLVARIRADNVAAEKRVRDVTHHSRNPLHRLMLRVDENLCWPEFEELRTSITSDVFFVKECLRSLHGTVVRPRESIDLTTLSKEVVADFQCQAEKKACTIVIEAPPSSLHIRGNPLEVRTVLENLLDNGVKYSWHGLPGAPQRIRVRLDSDGVHAHLQIENYGIGIPQEKIQRMTEGRERGVRGQVPDKAAVRRWGEHRKGTGLGIPLSIEVLERHGGWLELESHEADSGQRESGQQFHRYLTTVNVFIPLGD